MPIEPPRLLWIHLKAALNDAARHDAGTRTPQWPEAKTATGSGGGASEADPAFVAAILEQHRRALVATRGLMLDPVRWRADLVLALRQFLVTRLPMYALIDRFRPQPFLPRLVRSAAQLTQATANWIPTAP